MRKFLTLILAIFLVLPVYAQVGRYKNIKLLYPGYSLKLDTATGELSAVHFDDETEKTIEETLLKKQSHNARQVGRYELRRTKRLGTWDILEAIAFFSNVEGVTAVERDHIYHLTDPVKPRMEVL